MPSDIPAWKPSLVLPPGTEPQDASSSASPPPDIAELAVEFRQIDAEAKVVNGTVEELARLNRQLSELSDTLGGSLSNYSREAVEEMKKLALDIEQKIHALQNPEQARTDAPGL